MIALFTTRARKEARANIALAIPIVATQLGTMLLGLIDTALVGRVGERPLAAVALGNTLTFAAIIPGVGVLLAIDPLTSQAMGSGSRRQARATFTHGVWLSAALSIPAMILAFLSLQILAWLRVDPTIIPETRAYVLARLWGILPFYLFMAGKTYQQAVLRPRGPTEAVVIANVVHLITGWLAVFGDGGLNSLHLPGIGLPALGATGAGIATSVSSWVLAAWVIGVRGRTPSGAVDDIGAPVTSATLDRALFLKMVRVGTPIGLQLLAEVGVFSLVTVMMGKLGGRAVAAHQIALGLASLSFMGALGVAQATGVRVGNAVGAGSAGTPRTAGVVGIAVGMAARAGSAVAFALAPRFLARLFSPELPVVAAAVPLIGIAALFQLADGMQVVAAGALRGAGDTRWPLFANVITHWCVGFPLGYWLAFPMGYGANGLWYGLTAGLFIIGAALTMRFVWITRKPIAML